jgi:hypothetical protein
VNISFLATISYNKFFNKISPEEVRQDLAEPEIAPEQLSKLKIDIAEKETIEKSDKNKEVKNKCNCLYCQLELSGNQKSMAKVLYDSINTKISPIQSSLKEKRELLVEILMDNNPDRSEINKRLNDLNGKTF